LWSGFLALLSQEPGRAMLMVQGRPVVGLKIAVGREVSMSISALGCASLFLFFDGLSVLCSWPFWWMTTDEALRFW
jgi:hypothetical protein